MDARRSSSRSTSRTARPRSRRLRSGDTPGVHDRATRQLRVSSVPGCDQSGALGCRHQVSEPAASDVSEPVSRESPAKELSMSDKPTCYASPRLVGKDCSEKGGRGVFAREPIARGELLVV